MRKIIVDALFGIIPVFSVAVSCNPPPAVEAIAPIKDKDNEKYSSLRGKRYVVYIADEDGNKSKISRAIENKMRSILADKGLVVISFDQHELANILKNDGRLSEEQTKSVASNADLIITGHVTIENLSDAEINKNGTFRSRVSVQIAITETVSSIEKGRVDQQVEELANNYESAGFQAAQELGSMAGEEAVKKLLYIYDK